MTPKFIMTASSKGGVGKSTVALGVARALAKRKFIVLIVDLDFGNACLDILTGCENSVLYTVFDVSCGNCTAADAVNRVPGEDSGRLYLLPAPAGGGELVCDAPCDGHVTPEQLSAAVKAAADCIEADFVIIDTGAGVSGGARAAAMLCGTAAVVASHNPTSLRAAENTAARLRGTGVQDVRLVVNSFDAAGLCAKNKRTGLLDIIDQAKVPMLGAVPYDYNLTLSQENPDVTCDGGAATAFGNIAGRLCGEYIPLFSGIRELRKLRKKLFR